MTTSEQPRLEDAPRVLCDRRAEDAVLGACLINQDMFPIARGILASEDFYIHRNRWIFDAMGRLRHRQEAIDVITVGAELGPEMLKEIGGSAYLSALTNAPDSSLNAESYARIVSDLALRRKIVAAGQNMATLAFEGDLGASDLVSCAYIQIRKASDGIKTGKPQLLGDVLAGVRDRTAERARSGKMPGISTGFTDLDARLGGGWQSGQLIVVSGSPGGGKSAFLATVARHGARTCRVRFHTLEMSADDIGGRLLAQASGINSQAIDTGQLRDDSEWHRLDAAVESLGRLQLVIDSTVPISVPDLRAICLRDKVDLLIIDYTGLMKSPGEGEYDQQRALSRDLKNLARELGIPIVVAHQLNRRSHELETPGMEHLRGSATWEHDPDVVLLLYPRKEAGRGRGLPYRLEIAKHRNGPTGYVDLIFRAQTTEFLAMESQGRDEER